jgi:hypothetical protein
MHGKAECEKQQLSFSEIANAHALRYSLVTFTNLSDADHNFQTFLHQHEHSGFEVFEYTRGDAQQGEVEEINVKGSQPRRPIPVPSRCQHLSEVRG